jgi:hypothetical protein
MSDDRCGEVGDVGAASSWQATAACARLYGRPVIGWCFAPGPARTTRTTGIGIAKSSPMLRNIIRTALSQLITSGVYTPC